MPKHDAIMVTNDGQTFTPLGGCEIILLPRNMEETEIADMIDGHDPETKAECESLNFSLDVKSSLNTQQKIKLFMSIFLPKGKIKYDNNGQMIIETGVYS